MPANADPERSSAETESYDNVFMSIANIWTSYVRSNQDLQAAKRHIELADAEFEKAKENMWKLYVFLNQEYPE